MKYIRELPNVDELHKELSLTDEEKEKRIQFIRSIRNIFSGADDRKLVIIGPCSADREDAVLEYVGRLAKISEEVQSKLLIIPRIYTSKPRTSGAGYKGMVHNPYGNTNEDLWQGIVATRALHLHVIRESGLFSADEMLYPDEIYYISDLLCYMSVGARSTEDQGHRMVASDDEIPVGFKNSISGSKRALVNSISAAQMPQRLVYRGWEVETAGNPFAHAILRGYVNNNGVNYPNYREGDLRELKERCADNHIVNPGVIIDCNHANSNKHYEEQPRIASEVQSLCKQDKDINSFVKGYMIESYLEDGSQEMGGGVFGRSITDPCIGWEKTEKLLRKLAE